MASCKSCKYWRKEYDDFRNDFNDAIIIDDKNPPPHFCVMYDDNIPNGIFYENEDCPFFVEKE